MATDDEGLDATEAKRLARAAQSFMEWVAGAAQETEDLPEIVTLLRAHLGTEGLAASIVSGDFTPLEHVNVQVALDAWSGAADRAVEVVGVSMPSNWGDVEMHQLVHGHGLPPVQTGPPDLVDLPAGPGRTIACWRSAVLLVTDGLGTYAIFVSEPSRHSDRGLLVQVAGLPVPQAQALLRELDDLRRRHSVFRGQVVEVLAAGRHGGLVASFPQLPPTGRDDVVLPDAVLTRIERHCLDVARHREALRAAGRHLKRGLLLYGPPGTGKTHTVRYLVQHMPGTTALVMSGASLQFVDAAAQIARELEPAVVVLEDVDLVAEDRDHGNGLNPLLFELLDAMDGSAPDADLLFLLTTNRVQALERALATRPGRVDVAVEIGLPDEESLRRLFEVYARGVDLQLDAADVTEVLARLDGVTASFVKELIRRAVVEALDESGSTTVHRRHLAAAADDLLDSSQAVTRALLGGVAGS